MIVFFRFFKIIFQGKTPMQTFFIFRKFRDFVALVKGIFIIFMFSFSKEVLSGITAATKLGFQKKKKVKS